MENTSTNNKKTWVTPEIFNESLEETKGKQHYITSEWTSSFIGSFGPS